MGTGSKDEDNSSLKKVYEYVNNKLYPGSSLKTLDPPDVVLGEKTEIEVKSSRAINNLERV